MSGFLLEDYLYFGVNEMISSQKLVGKLDKMTVANLGRQHRRSLDFYFQEFLKKIVSLWSYKLLFHTIYIAQTHCLYF